MSTYIANSIIETNITPAFSMDKNTSVNTIIIDSSGRFGDDIYSMNELHKNNGESMFTHHYFITKDGKIFRGRDELYVPVIDSKFKNNCVGIMLEGDFNNVEMNVVQFNVLMNLIYEIMSHHPYIGTSAFTHSELDGVNYAHTPGKLFPYVDFRNRVYRNFISYTDQVTDITGDSYYTFGSRNIEHTIPNMTGNDIYQLKVLLSTLGYTFNEINNVYDTELKTEINKFFIDNNISKHSYTSDIITIDNQSYINDKVNNIVYNRDERYKRHLFLTEPLQFGADIAIIRNKLWVLGFLETLEPENVFDADMEEAVKSFERKYGLTEDGKVGNLLFDEILKCIDYSFKRVLQLEEPLLNGADVEIIQKALFRMGYNVEVTGFYDLTTHSAVCSFQLANNLDVDGRIDRTLFELILKDYS